ncbi:hypothetical protein JW979_13805, partial [bacterium]|nr:hypothetical protein [candidate division CSSED10-310 bacterium]
ITPTLQMAAMDPQWMETYLEKNPGSIKAEKLQDRILITASTDELQAFFLKHINDEGLLGEYSDLRKMPEKTPDNS